MAKYGIGRALIKRLSKVGERKLLNTSNKNVLDYISAHNKVNE
jgi:hypothetical protein